MTDAFAMVVRFQAAPGREGELRERLLALVGPTRVEDGCVQYDLHVDEADPTRLAFYEVWASKAAHAAHDASTHVQSFRAVRDGLLAEPATVTRLTPIEP